MGLYVDELMHHGMKLYGRPTKSCHLFADSEAELRDAGDKMRLKQGWAHRSSRGVLHFDLTEVKRHHAVRIGAEQLTVQESVRKHGELAERHDPTREQASARLG